MTWLSHSQTALPLGGGADRVSTIDGEAGSYFFFRNLVSNLLIPGQFETPHGGCIYNMEIGE